MKIRKTNTIRLIEKENVDYELRTYEVDESDLSGIKVASQVGLPAEQVYKTLVAKGDCTGYLVCVIAVDKEVDFKKLALESSNKRVEMIPVKELLPITGFIRGGCSPIAMKKKFPTYIDEDIEIIDIVAVSAGIRGCQVLLKTKDLIILADAKVCSITR